MPTANPYGLRILLVDDHEDTLGVLKRLLRLEGHSVTATNGSRCALDLFRTESFDLVMSDIGLPEMDGRELLAQLRGIRPIKSIAITGYGAPDELQAVRAAGFDDVLLKPITFEALIRSMEKVVTRDGHDGSDGHDGRSVRYAPDPKVLQMKLENYEKVLSMLTTEVERRKVEAQVSQIRRRLSEISRIQP